MRKILLAVALCMGTLLGTCLAFAGDTTGVYVAGKGGITFENSDNKGKVTGGYGESYSFMNYGIQTIIQDIFSSSSHNQINTAGTFGGAVGYAFPQFPVRFEVEYLYRTQTSSNFSAGGVSTYQYSIVNNTTGANFYNLGGVLSTGVASFKREDTIHTLMFNGYWDIVEYNGFVPYVGGGIGMAFHNMRDSAHTILTYNGSTYSYPGASMSKDRTVTCFAWMASAGVAYKINDNWAIDLGYRLISFGDAGSSSMTGAYTSLMTGSQPVYETASIKSNTALSNEVLMSVRYTF